MFLYKCIGFTYITDTILSLISKCNLFINKSQILQCLNKEYMYSKYCNITNDMCECIQNKIIYDYSLSDMKYYLIIIYIALVIISVCCCYTKMQNLRFSNGRYIMYNLENNDENTNQDTNENTNQINQNANNTHNYNYIINKTDSLPKYNEIDDQSDIQRINMNIKEIKPPKYDEIV
jgi:hypothetical protein